MSAKKLPTLIAKTSVVTKTSTRQELKFMSTIFKACGGDINEASISQATIWRQRKTEVTAAALEKI